MNRYLYIVRVLSLFGFLLASNAAKAENLTVVELYTSQGCSSCPPADKVLADVRTQDDILALGFHVDYWNYLGWKDTFAQAEFTKRQRDYNRSLEAKSVYTPQIIVHGLKGVVGSRKSDVKDLINFAETRRTTGPAISFAQMDGEMFKLHVPKGESVVPATIWLVGYDHRKTVDIKRGELRGKTQTYHNVVRSLKRVGTWHGDEIKLTLDKEDLSDLACDDYAIIIQQRDTGPVLAASRLKRL